MALIKKSAKKFADDTKLPSPADAAVKTAAGKAVVAAIKKSATATKVAPVKAADDNGMVTLRLPEGTEELDRWFRTPLLPGHKFKHWFDKTKKGLTFEVDKKGVKVTLPKSEAAHRNMMEYVEGAK